MEVIDQIRSAERYPSEQGRLFEVDKSGAESYSFDRRRKILVRTVRTAHGDIDSPVALADWCASAGIESNADSYDASWLRARMPPIGSEKRRNTLRVVDMFSGCGGLSLGISEAARACGFRTEHPLAIDVNEDALRIFKANFPNSSARKEDIAAIFPGNFGDPISPVERAIANELGAIDFLVGGPPCQGHSDLNNHTRRSDPRNSLFFHMARCAEVLRPNFVFIENVPGVVHDKSNVVQRTADALRSLGYQVATALLRALDLGVPQTRKRFVLVASRTGAVDLLGLTAAPLVAPRSFAWACADLAGQNSNVVFDSAANHSPTNQARINYLFDHNLFDLPNEQRPDCHRLKEHSYNSVYGRLQSHQPVPTITRGFGSTGQGRFVHPTERRSLTPHEAARLQFFPDYFSFADVKRYAMQIIIGNAVPSKLAYAVGVTLLSEIG